MGCFISLDRRYLEFWDENLSIHICLLMSIIDWLVIETQHPEETASLLQIYWNICRMGWMGIQFRLGL
ncbi:hypothetical protein L218DRAFT_968593 [Marasmius fiardii PR-910]|nr:hypothetical protein L218DRAFT_968593 [Marasmius fiardii PR-910]